jgi:hypothetical protein
MLNVTIPENPESIEMDTGKRWFEASDGSYVYDSGPETHVWARRSPMSAQCIFCGVLSQNREGAKCEKRTA